MQYQLGGASKKMGKHQVTGEAIGKATTDEAQPKTTTFSINFGTFEFTINHEENQRQTKHGVLPDTLMLQTPLTTTTDNKEIATHNRTRTQSDRANNNKQQPTQRFVKIPPATGTWQRAVSRKKHETQTAKRCFYCHKKGHVQKKCWRKHKCFNCDQPGHKCANCPIKPKKFLPTTQTGKPQTKIAAKTNTDSQLQNMEIIHGRPPLGDFFCSPNQTLNEENTYLCKVGLVILIRGTPSPNLARLVASKMAEIHGGHQADYAVTEATIAPYVITCPSMQTRDAIVQQGLYTIAQGRIQFAVHEWRPRFGMGYDPPTHQVWVKLVGLPLQAWTETGIVQFLRSFSHPLQIMPYGQAAGHYRNITALVETKHPRRIPQAYAYREGEYTTQVDVLVLAWRQWIPTPFPPPDSPPPGEGHSAHAQAEDDWTTPAHRSPSSASSSVPSEPTVDLSAWSPRSHRMSQKPQFGNPTWKIKGKSTEKEVIKGTIGRDKQVEHQIASSLRYNQTMVRSSVSPVKSTPPCHKSTHTPATENPTPTSQFKLAVSLLHTSLWTVPSPITINSLTSLRTVLYDSSTSRAARKNFRIDILDWGYSVPPEDNQTLKGKKRRLIVLSMRDHYAQSISDPSRKEYSTLRVDTSPTRPKLLRTHSGPREEMFARNINNEAHVEISMSQQSEENSDDQYLQGPPGFQMEMEVSTPTQSHLQLTASQADHYSTEGAGPSTLELDSQQGLSPSPALKLQHHNKQKGKKKVQPTRRSQRLQIKKSLFLSNATSPTKSTSHTGKIPFDLTSRETPLDAPTTLMILQATGLQINEEVQQIVHQASTQQEPTPGTPLHDFAPPLIIPGEDMVL